MGKVYQDFEEDGERRIQANLPILFSQTGRREESRTTIVPLIMVPSLDSASPFRRGPHVDLQRAEDLGTNSTETTNTSRRSLTGTRTLLQIIERRGGTLSSTREMLNSFSVTELQNSEKSTNSKFESANNRSKNVIPVRGGGLKYFIKNWQIITKDAIILSTVQWVSLYLVSVFSYPVQEKIPHPPMLNSE